MRAREREGERIALVSARLRLRQQQSIDLLFIIVHYSPLCTVYLSLSGARAFFPLFLLSTASTPFSLSVRLYLSLRHVSRAAAYV